MINYRDTDVAAAVRDITGGAGVDHVVDVDLGGNLAATLGSVRENGSIAYYATNGAQRPEIDLRALMGSDIADGVALGMDIDPVKLAEVAPTLPLPDAELLEKLLKESGIPPLRSADPSLTPEMAGTY